MLFNRKKIFFLFVFALTGTNLFAQIQFDKKYDFGILSASRKTVEVPGAYISAGYHVPDTTTYDNNLLLKVNLYGDTIKTLYIPPPDSVYWHLYNEDPDDIFNDIIITSDSNIIALGRSQAYNPTNYYDYDILLVKLNYNLDTLWLKSYSHPQDSAFQPQSVIQTSDGGFLICGKMRNFYNIHWLGFLYKVDSNGIFQWYKSYNTPGPYVAIWDVRELPNHHFICSGATISSTLDIDECYFFTDSLGNQLNTFTIPTIGDAAYDEMIESNDNGFVLLGSENFSSGSNGLYFNCITKIDTAGAVIWKKNYLPYQSVGSPLAIITALNGGYIYVGISDNTTSSVVAYIHRLDENGDSLWYREFTSGNYNDFWDIKTTSDGGYIMSGQTSGCNNNGLQCFWLVKTDSLGLITGIAPTPASEPQRISLFPNPANDIISVTINSTMLPTQNIYGKKGTYLLFFDATGRQIKEIAAQEGENKINIASFQSGIYLCVLAVDGYNAGSIKFIKH